MSAAVATDLDRRLAADRRAVELTLKRQLAAERGVPARLREAMAHAVLGGGKRLRPILLLWTCEALGGARRRDDALAAGAALEFLHTYSLIHDDLPAMDDDDLRRGRQTCHVAFDEATAILAGDGLLTRAFGVLAEVPRVGDRLVATLAAAAGPAGMVGGQQEDLDAEGADLSAALVRRIHLGKTARLIAAALTMGGHIARADGETLAGLERAGRKLGLAFQAADDLLDATSDAATLGKTAGKDAAADKPTWVRFEGIEAAGKRARRYGREGSRALAGLLGDDEPSRRLLDLTTRLWRRDR